MRHVQSTLLPLKRTYFAIHNAPPIHANVADTIHLSCKRRLSSETKSRVTIRNALGKPTPYVKGWVWQHVLLERRLKHERRQAANPECKNNWLETIIDHSANEDWLLVFEHEPVYTLGRGASEDHLKFLATEDDVTIRRLNKKYRGEDAARLIVRSAMQNADSDQLQVDDLLKNGAIQDNPVCAPNNVPIYRIERGGEVTYHGPGQLVLYPLLNLRNSPFHQDLHWYLRQIEEIIIRTLKEYGISSNRDKINTGVWVGPNKIAAVGVSSSRWITTHGCALNVNLDLDAFSQEIITPCGIEKRGVTSMKKIMKDDCPSVEEVADVALRYFGDVFNVELINGDAIV